MKEFVLKYKTQIKEIMIYAVIFLVTFIVFMIFFCKVYVPTTSMENNIMPGDCLLAFKHFTVKRGDIIEFKNPKTRALPDSERGDDYLKRVIGLPGETVTIVNGEVCIDGEKLNEDYLKETPDEENLGPFIVPEGHYFCMGDNRKGSDDARYWQDPYVPEDEIIGRVFFRYKGGFRLYKRIDYE